MLCERTGLSNSLKGFCHRGFLYCMSVMDMIDGLACCTSAFDVKLTDSGTLGCAFGVHTYVSRLHDTVVSIYVAESVIRFG